MLKIDVIKFETQDVITTSIPAPEGTCYCNDYCMVSVDHAHPETCTDCKKER